MPLASYEYNQERSVNLIPSFHVSSPHGEFGSVRVNFALLVQWRACSCLPT